MTVTTFAFVVCLGLSGGAQSQGASPSPSPTPATYQLTTLESLNAELKAAARAYQLGNFAEAEQHSRNAVQLNPDNRTARMYVARTVHAQYRPRVTTEENVAKARQAIEEYKNILKLSPKDEEAYKAIAYLLGDVKDTEQLNAWIMQRATDESFEPEKRSEAFIVLASKHWDCSFKTTEQNKVTTIANDTPKVTYVMPKDPSDFQTATTCVSEGLAEIDHAISLTPASESAWSYKVNLLIERSKLLEMEGKLLVHILFRLGTVEPTVTTPKRDLHQTALTPVPSQGPSTPWRRTLPSS